MAVDLTITEDGRGVSIGSTELEGVANVAQVRRALARAINDIADAVEKGAKAAAPTGPERPHDKKPQQRLHEHGVVKDRAAVISAEASTGRFRGAGGLFLPGKPGAFGNVVARQAVRLDTVKVPHALFVHEGTAAFHVHGEITPFITPKRKKFMAFFSRGHWHRRKSVSGQQPNPFLFDAARVVDATYVPLRLEVLRGELAALT